MNKSTGKDMHRMFSGATMKHRAAIAIVAASCPLPLHAMKETEDNNACFWNKHEKS